MKINGYRALNYLNILVKINIHARILYAWGL